MIIDLTLVFVDFKVSRMPLADANTRSLEERIEILNFRTGNKNVGFMQVKMETLRVAPLEVG